MTKALRPLSTRVALLALAAMFLLAAIGASSAGAISVKLRVEGATKTQFNGTVTTGPRSVPGGVDDPTGCRANAVASDFSAPNGLTALADAVGASNVTTSGSFFSFGTQLCSVNGESPPSGGGGWLTRINQIDPSAPKGYVTATDPLQDGDSVLIYVSPSYGYFSSSLELRLPAEAQPGQPVTGYVDEYDTSTDVKSNGSGAVVSGGGASGTTAGDGSVSLTFPSAGRFLLTTTKKGAIRGSAWVTVDPAATVVPVKPSRNLKELRYKARRKCLRAYKWHRTSSPRYKKCAAKANSIGKGK